MKKHPHFDRINLRVLFFVPEGIMANGIEDLREKNKETEKKIKPHEFTQWTNFQGREDAEMLEEKSSGWSALKSSKGYYDAWED